MRTSNFPEGLFRGNINPNEISVRLKCSHELKYKKIEIRDPQEILAYLIRIARNIAIDVYRKRAVGKAHGEKLFHFLVSTQGDESAEIIAERSDLVAYLTNSLSDEERTVIDLHLEEEMTFREIGSILDISTSAAQKQFDRVIKKLRLKLK